MSNFIHITPANFEAEALKLFHWQRKHNALYGKFCQLLGRNSGDIQRIDHIPFLPVELFKKHSVVCGNGTN